MLFTKEENSPDYKLTKNMLLQISKHICQTQKCRKREFVITISNYFSDEYIDNVSEVSMTPVIELFPDLKHRKKSDKTFLLYHVCRDHLDLDEIGYRNGHVFILPSLAEGTYMFKFNGARRSWVRGNRF